MLLILPLFKSNIFLSLKYYFKVKFEHPLWVVKTKTNHFIYSYQVAYHFVEPFLSFAMLTYTFSFENIDWTLYLFNIYLLTLILKMLSDNRSLALGCFKAIFRDNYCRNNYVLRRRVGCKWKFIVQHVWPVLRWCKKLEKDQFIRMHVCYYTIRILIVLLDF